MSTMRRWELLTELCACTSHGTCPMNHRARDAPATSTRTRGRPVPVAAAHQRSDRARQMARGTNHPDAPKKPHTRQHPPNAPTAAKKNTDKQLSNPLLPSSPEKQNTNKQLTGKTQPKKSKKVATKSFEPKKAKKNTWQKRRFKEGFRVRIRNIQNIALFVKKNTVATLG